MAIQLDHIGILVRNIDEALPHYTDILGFSVLHDERVQATGVRVLFLDAGSVMIQLVEPFGQGQINDDFQRYGEGLHHLCYAVNDIEGAVRRLAPGADVRIFPGSRDQRAAFLPRDDKGILVELTEVSPGEEER
ncbi:MAG TPA: VOC family protein [Thermomicrobiales bacterium]|nr:VOC family protein [Thermomicrobiales bacterium]